MVVGSLPIGRKGAMMTKEAPITKEKIASLCLADQRLLSFWIFALFEYFKGRYIAGSFVLKHFDGVYNYYGNIIDV